MAHVGQKGRACLGHVQGAATGILQFLIGLTQAAVAGFEFVGTGRDDVFQFVQVLSQAIFGVASLLNLGGHADELLVGDLDQYADLIVLVAFGVVQARLSGLARIAAAQRADDRDQRLGQHDVEQSQQDHRQHQAAGKTIEQGDAGALEETTAKGVSVDVQVQRAQVVLGHVRQIQRVFELALLAEQKVA